MKTKSSRLLLFPLLLCGACRTTPIAGRSSGPVRVHREPSARERQDRVAEVTKAGRSREAAERQARREFASNAWSDDTANAWADEKAREERADRHKRMEKALANLPAN
jgi:hypothetical protein